MITSLMYYPTGFTGAINEKYEQDRTESEPWYITILRHYLKQGLIADNTIVRVPATYSGPLSSLRQVVSLPVSPPTPCWFSLSFYTDGRTEAILLDGSTLPLNPWPLTALQDKVTRKVLHPECKLVVPNIFSGSVATFLKNSAISS